jgi:hypothetical protein
MSQWIFVVKRQDTAMEIMLSREDLILLTNSINEVLCGFEVRDFDRRIGSRREAEELLRALVELYKDVDGFMGAETCQITPVRLSASQARVLGNALKAVSEEFYDSEFQTRLGSGRVSDRDLVLRLAGAERL